MSIVLGIFLQMQVFSATRCFPSGITESSAGKRTRVKETQNRTPAAQIIRGLRPVPLLLEQMKGGPRLWSRVVIRIASPEWPIA
ncbi:MAG: hypothetical protein Ct9H300mP28_11130 [Pseudomonadota bacterium]|nr:MAG: hypothetical protein Ct9H300mP28_11130 [Pseudomonadota bacterium]